MGPRTRLLTSANPNAVVCVQAVTAGISSGYVESGKQPRSPAKGPCVQWERIRVKTTREVLAKQPPP